jgi:hypothetical protein
MYIKEIGVIMQNEYFWVRKEERLEAGKGKNEFQDCIKCGDFITI